MSNWRAVILLLGIAVVFASEAVWLFMQTGATPGSGGALFASLICLGVSMWIRIERDE